MVCVRLEKVICLKELKITGKNKESIKNSIDILKISEEEIQ